MTKQQAIKVLAEHNKWRRGGEGPASDPLKLGKAIDTAIRLLSEPVKCTHPCCENGRIKTWSRKGSVPCPKCRAKRRAKK